MPKHGTAFVYNFGQLIEVQYAVGKSLASILPHHDPKELLKALGEKGEELSQILSVGFEALTAAPQPSPPEVPQFLQDLFIPAVKQLELAKLRNAERKWDFKDEDFQKLGEPPTWPEGQLCAVVLEVCLDTVEKTFEEAWYHAYSVQPDKWRWEKLKSDVKHLRLLSGIQYQRGLRWRVVDLAANWNRKDGISPKDARDAKKSPHCAILWAASYFPNWVQAMDGINVPYAWIAGYEANVAGRQWWSLVPALGWHRDDRQVRLRVGLCAGRGQAWAVPEFRES